MLDGVWAPVCKLEKLLGTLKLMLIKDDEPRKNDKIVTVVTVVVVVAVFYESLSVLFFMVWEKMWAHMLLSLPFPSASTLDQQIK